MAMSMKPVQPAAFIASIAPRMASMRSRGEATFARWGQTRKTQAASLNRPVGLPFASRYILPPTGSGIVWTSISAIAGVLHQLE